jgi:phosphatidate cytidylyltransferase
MFVLPCVWLADTGAFLLGAAYGKHRMAPRLSPKKTWEGYAAGALTAMLTGGFFAYAYTAWGPLHIPVWAGAVFGLVVGLLTPLGDLGESMIKRQAAMKDSGNIFPGHGGAFDRIDSWLWAAMLGFYFITWFIR